MNELETEVAIEVLKERQRVQEIHLKDVDECCGKLKGMSVEEHRVICEELSALKQDMKHACSGVETDVEVLRTYSKQQKECIKDCSSEKITKYFNAAKLFSENTALDTKALP